MILYLMVSDKEEIYLTIDKILINRDYKSPYTGPYIKIRKTEDLTTDIFLINDYRQITLMDTSFTSVIKGLSPPSPI